MKMIRCRICGETYLGYETPTNCPFCGAHAELMVEANQYPDDINNVQLTESERADLEKAVEIETANARFYIAMSAHHDNSALSSAYKRLSRIEAEHCSVFCKLLKVAKPEDLTVAGEASDDWCENIDESLARERFAKAFYAEVVERATSPRIVEVFAAVSEVEADHIALDEVAKGYADC